MIKHSIILCLLFAFCSNIVGQNKAKFNAKLGYTAYRFADEADLLKGQSHPTQFFGFDMVLQNNRGVFIPGFHYGKMAIQANDFKFGELFENRENIHFVRMPLSFGYAFSAGNLIEIIPYAGANASFFLKVDENNAGVRLDIYNGVQAGMQAGVHIKVLTHLTIDINYDHSFLQRIKTRDDSKTRGWIFSAGIVF